ncbi:MAG TPA: hypothetical protein PK523_03380 [Elusimicrobiales bacterium]|nr:hypothetical protein [Elusimicrobiales bacterium]
MDLDPRGYEGETDLDKIKDQERLAEIRRLRASTGLLLALIAGILLLALQFIGSRRGSVTDRCQERLPSAYDAVLP